MDDDKDGKDNKAIFEKITEAFNDVVDTASAEKANEQVLMDAAIAAVAVPAVEENPHPCPLTADELSHYAATDTQTIAAAKKTPKKKAAMPSLSGRTTPTYDFPVPDTPMPSLEKPTAVKNAKESARKSAKELKSPPRRP